MLSNAYSFALERAVMPVGDRLNGGNFMHWLRRYRSEQWLMADEIQSVARERLSTMLAYARATVPFYKGTFDRGLDPFDELQSFPIVSKSDVKQNLSNMITQPLAKLTPESGSGSSGLQGTVYVDKSAQASQRAMQMLWFEWGGYRMGDSILQTGITPERGFVKGTKDVLLNTKYINAFNLGEETLIDILKNLRKRPRKFLFGYASSLHVLAKAALDRGFNDVSFQHAVSWGDKLFPHYRKSIKEAFGCDVTDTYGCTEGAMIAAQCHVGSYHLSINQCHVEIVDDEGGQVPEGELGNVVVTRLDNFAMPLIRYRLGDIAAIERVNAPCKCGRHTPTLKGLIGRDTDVITSPGGKKMIVHFFTGIFEHVPEIRQFKVVQRTLDNIEIQFVPADNFNDAVLPRIEERISSRLEESLPVKWSRVENISASGSGKPQIVESLLPTNGNGTAATREVMS